MPITQNTTHVSTALSRLLEQFKGNHEMRAMLESWVTQIQEFEDVAFQVLNGRGIDEGEGVQLDGIGQIVGQPREGIDDATYRFRLKARILLNASSGTIPEILQIFDLLVASDQNVALTEYFPASFLLTVGGDSGTTAARARELLRILNEATAGGVGRQLIYSTDSDDNTFTFSDDDTTPTSTTQGFNGTAVDLDWVSRNAAVNNSWRSIAWAPTLGTSGRLVAVAQGTGTNQVMTSDDGGASWTARTASAARSWNSVCWAPALSLFVAVASDGALLGRVMTSPDGITWTSRTAANGEWASVAWSPSLARFVAVGLSGGPNYAMTSTDGTTWTASGVTQVAGYWTSVTAAGSLGFVAVGQFDTGSGQVMVASTGLNWAAGTVTAANQWTSVAWSSTLSLLVAVSIDGANRVMTSTNGTAWTARSAAAANSWWAVTWSPTFGYFVALSTDGTNQVMMSADGITWLSDSAITSKSWQSIVDANEISQLVGLASADLDSVMTADTTVTNVGGKFADVASL